MFTIIPRIRDIEVVDVVSDIKSHLTLNHSFTNYGYYLADKTFNYDEIGTWAHESCHEINSNVRNKQSVKSNCAYWLDDRAYIKKEIDTIFLSDIAKAVPENLKGYGYNLYLIEQQRYWNNEPLYIIDELAAYRAGTLARMQNKEDPGYSCSLYIEFCGYLAVLINITSEFVPLLHVAMSDACEMVEDIKTSRNLKGQLEEVQEYIDGPKRNSRI